MRKKCLYPTARVITSIMDFFAEAQKFELQKDDTFTFECTMCGECCRQQPHPLVLTGVDLFRIARALGVTPLAAFNEYAEVHTGRESHLPVVSLKKQSDGSCSLLRQGKCIAHEGNPIACALYPFGRYYKSQEDVYHYYLQEGGCGHSKEEGRQWTLQEWLDYFNLEEAEQMSTVWERLCIGLARFTKDVDMAGSDEAFFKILLYILYLGYDTDKPYIKQVETSMRAAKTAFRNTFGVELKF